MRSIDNLREYALTAASVNATTKAVLAGYVDGIERDVAALTDERDLLKRQWEAGVDFDQRLESCADNREDVTLWGVDYMPNPLDADGVPIHVGDVMEWVDEPGITRTVTSIQLANDGWWVYINGTGRRPDKYRHHHAPTVEDVLREMLKHFGAIEEVTPEVAEYIAEYAAKLQLKEG